MSDHQAPQIEPEVPAPASPLANPRNRRLVFGFALFCVFLLTLSLIDQMLGARPHRAASVPAPAATPQKPVAGPPAAAPVAAQPSGQHPVPLLQDAVRLYHDPQSGCDYLALPGYGLTPRLDSNGRPMCGQPLRNPPHPSGTPGAGT